tara:strand:+ start:205 stop:333 length:129 start_codon:yes stop_codon:yes gene_type:complete
MRQGRFPKGHKLIKGGQAVGWWDHEIRAFMNDQLDNSEDLVT